MEDYLPFDVQKLHTTLLGEERIKRNLNFEGCEVDIVKLMCDMILDDSSKFERKGKNWYVTSGHCRITVNSSSLTIITAHRI